MRNGGTGEPDSLCALITLDVKIAFNSARCRYILEKQEQRKISPFVRKMLSSYLTDRTVLVGEGEEMKEIKISSDVPQGSVLGPTLWNVLYYGVLRRRIPEGVNLVGVADDLALVLVARTKQNLRLTATAALEQINAWMETKSLKLALEKTEAVLIVGRKKLSDLPLELLGVEINKTRSVEYVDKNLNHSEHSRKAAEKADRTITALFRLMPNVKGPKASKKKVLRSVAQSVLMYGVPVWSEALEVKRNLAIMDRVMSKATLCICSAYRTVSTAALMVIAGVIPIHKMAEERRRLYEDRGAEGGANKRKALREQTIAAWQSEREVE